MIKNKRMIKYIVSNIIILLIIYLLFLLNIRICLVYNLFKIPCPGCGLTRAIMYLVKGDIINSIKYNLLGIPICIGYIACNIWYIIDIIKNQNTFFNWMNKNKTPIIIICIILFVISYSRNLTNPLLY